MTSHMRGKVLIFLLVGSLVFGSAGAVMAGPLLQQDATPLLAAARADLESLANELLGDGARPAGWTSSYDVSAMSFALDLRLDLETLAGNQLSPDERPGGWLGAVPGTAWSIARDIRHDLELLADHLLGEGVRPAIWVGGDPLMRCDRALQAMVTWLLRTNPSFNLSAVAPGPDYCARVEQETNQFVELLTPGEPPPGDLRADLNALDEAIFRAAVVPDGWSGGNEASSIRQDLEILRLASNQVGGPVDPANWFGEVFGSPWVVARANRHDLEVLADAKLGFNQRPPGWTYEGALVRCPRTVQNLVMLLQSSVGLLYEAQATGPGFCQQVALEVSGLVEGGQLDPGTGGGGEAAAPAGLEEGPSASGVVTVGGIPGAATNPNAYLDRFARLRIGVIPRGTPFTALARSSTPDSRMMLVQGEGFVVWVAWPWTTITVEQYLSLPFADAVKDQLPQLLCFAAFCQNVVHNGDPLGRGVVGMSGSGGYAGVSAPGSNLQYLDYRYTRFLFDYDNVGAGWAEFRIELCPVPGNYNACEPVLRLYEHGQLVQPVRVTNGYPVWRMTYNLHSTVRLESQHYYVNQLWVTHPSDDRTPWW